MGSGDETTITPGTCFKCKEQTVSHLMIKCCRRWLVYKYIKRAPTQCRHLAKLFRASFKYMIHERSFQLLCIQSNCLRSYVCISVWIITTQPHLNVITSWGGQIFHEPWWAVEGTAGVQSTTALPIPERIIGIESVLDTTFTGSVTEVVIPHIGWDGDGHWVVDVSAGTCTDTLSEKFMKSSCKSSDVFPGNMSMCEKLIPST